MTIPVEFHIPGATEAATLLSSLQAYSAEAVAQRAVNVYFGYSAQAMVQHGYANGRLTLKYRLPPGSAANQLADLREGRLSTTPCSIKVGNMLLATNCHYMANPVPPVAQPANGLVEYTVAFNVVKDPPRAAAVADGWTDACVSQTLPDLSTISAGFQSDYTEATIATVNAGTVVWSGLPDGKFTLAGRLRPGARIPAGFVPLIEDYIDPETEAVGIMMPLVGLGGDSHQLTAGFAINTASEFRFAVADEGGFTVDVARTYEVVHRLLELTNGG